LEFERPFSDLDLSLQTPRFRGNCVDRFLLLLGRRQGLLDLGLSFGPFRPPEICILRDDLLIPNRRLMGTCFSFSSIS